MNRAEALSKSKTVKVADIQDNNSSSGKQKRIRTMLSDSQV